MKRYGEDTHARGRPESNIDYQSGTMAGVELHEFLENLYSSVHCLKYSPLQAKMHMLSEDGQRWRILKDL